MNKRRAVIVVLIEIFILGQIAPLFTGSSYADNFIQDDWSGGQSAQTAIHPADQTGWDTYSSKDIYTNTSVSGRIMMSPEISSTTDTSDIDFAQGTRDELDIVGTGASASLVLQSGLSDPFVSGLGEWTSLPEAPKLTEYSAFVKVGDYIYTLWSRKTFGRFDINTETWEFLADTPAPIGHGASLAYPGSGDLIYAARGAGSKEFWTYSTSTGLWNKLEDILYNVGGGGSLTAPGDGYVYCLVGNNTWRFLRYSISGHTWSELDTIEGNNVGHGGALAYPGSGNYLYASHDWQDNSVSRYKFRGTGAGSWSSCNGISYPTNLGWAGYGNYLYAWRLGSDTFMRLDTSVAQPTWESLPNLPTYGRKGIVYYPGTGTKIKILTIGNYTKPMSFDASTLKWDEPSGPPDSFRHAARMCYNPDNNSVYVTKGYPSDVYRQFYRYSLNENKWHIEADTPWGCDSGHNLVYLNGYIYATQGNNTAGFARFDPDSGWDDVNIADTPVNIGSGGALTTNGAYIYALQGGGTDKFLRYDPISNTWDDLVVADTPDTVSDGGALIYPGAGDYIYASRGGHTTTFWRYDIVSDTWSDPLAADAPFMFANKGTLMYPGNGDYIYAMPGDVYHSIFARYKFQGTSSDTWEILDSFPRYYNNYRAACATPNTIYAAHEADYELYSFDISNKAWAENFFNNTSSFYYGNVVYAGGDAYMFYGGYEHGTSHIWKYNLSQKKWTELIKAPFLMGRGTKACYPGSGNYIYVLEGRHSNHLWAYDYMNKAWQPSNDAPVGFFIGSQLDGEGSTLYACQGMDPSNPDNEKSRKFLSFTITTAPNGTWTELADLLGDIQGFSLTHEASNYYPAGNTLVHIPAQDTVYWKHNYSSNAFYAYNTTTGVWSNLAGVTGGPRGGCSLYYPGNGDFIYYQGGDYSGGFYKYSLQDDEWVTLAKSPLNEGYRGYDGDMFYPGSGDLLYVFDGINNYFTRYSITGDEWDIPLTFINNFITDKTAVFCGGKDGNTIYSGGIRFFYSYDIPSKTWTSLTSPYDTQNLNWSWENYDPALVYDGEDCLYGTRGSGYSDFVRYHINGNYWLKLASPPAAFGAFGAGHQLVAASSRIYALKGGNSSAFACYDPQTDSWQTNLSPIPQTINHGASMVYPGEGNFIYVTAGNNTPYFYSYDIVNNTWDLKANVPVALGGIGRRTSDADIGYGGASLVYPGKGDYIYLTQGSTRETASGESSSFFRYQIPANPYDDGQWEEIEPMPYACSRPSGELVYPGSGSYIYYWPGVDEYHILKYLVFKEATYTSEVKNIGQNSGYNTATWSDTGDGYFEFKARTSDDSSMAGALDWNSISILGKGQDLSNLYPAVEDTEKYIQYQIKFYAEDLSQLPALNDLTLRYEKYPHSQELVSNIYNSTEQHNRLTNLSWTETILAGTDVKLQLRTSPDGNNWTGWLGPEGTTSVIDDFSNEIDYARSSLIILENGYARLTRDLEDFQYKQEVIIDNTGLSNATNIVVTLNIDEKNNAFWSHIRPDGADIRFYDGTDKLSYYLAAFDYANKKASVDIEIPQLTADEVKTIYMLYGSNYAQSESNETVSLFPRNGLIGRWKFDEFNPGYNTTPDWSVNEHEAFVEGSTFTSQGQFGNAFDFDGNDYIRPPSVPNPGINWTIAAWVKPAAASLTGTHVIAAKGISGNTDDTNMNCQLSLNNGRVRISYEYGEGNTVYRESRDALAPDSWMHIVGIRDDANNSLDIYFYGFENNGASSSVSQLSQAPTGCTSGSFVIGRQGDSNSNYFYGTVDEVLLYNTALTSAEVSNLFNSYNVSTHETNDYYGKVYIAAFQEQTTSPTLGANWPYRETITLSNPETSDLTNYVVQVDLDSAHTGFWQHVRQDGIDDGGDIRLIDSDNTALLDYRLISIDTTAKTATILVEIPSIAASSSKTIYLYYGNSAANSTSDPSVSGESVPLDNLSGFWKFDDGSGNTAADSGVNGYNGTVYGAAWTANGKYRNAVSLDGSDDFVSMMDTLNEVMLPLTISAWVYWQGGESPVVTSDDHVSTYSGFWLTVNNDGSIELGIGDNSGGISTSDSNTKTSVSGVVTSDTWTHITGIISGYNDMNIFVDGNEVSGSYSGTLNDGVMRHRSDAFMAGRRSIGTDQYFNGEIDNLSIHNRQLLPYEVVKLAQSNIGDSSIVSFDFNEVVNDNYIDGSYPTSDPVIQPIFGAFYTNDLVQFIQSPSSQPSGTEIKYQVSPNGYEWYWFNGSWTAVTGGYSQTNTAGEVDANLATFMSQVATSGEFFYRAYLHSDGSSTPTLDQITIYTASANTYYQDSTGTETIDQSHTDAVDDRYFQYRALLYSSGENTPIVDDITLQYFNAYITLTSPVGGEEWLIGSSQDITWNSGGLTDIGHGIDETVRIEYSTDNGLSWTVEAANAPNTGTYQWTVDDDHSAQAKVKITSNGWPMISDETTGIFRIHSSIDLTYPDGGDRLVATTQENIAWSTPPTHTVPEVKIEYSLDNGTSWTEVLENEGTTQNDGIVTNDGVFEWTVPDQITTQDSCLIRISDSIDADTEDESAAPFRIIGEFAVTAPAQDETLLANSPYDVIWTTKGNITQVYLSYSLDGGASWSDMDGNPGGVTIINNNQSNGTTTYTWAVPDTLSDTCLIRIEDPNDSSVDTLSDNFYIRGLTLTSPDGQEEWELGYSHSITWSSLGAIAEPLSIYLSYDSGTTWVQSPITSGAQNTGSYPWPIYSAIYSVSDTCRIKIVDDNGREDISNADFRIMPNPAITITSPIITDSWIVGTPQNITWTTAGNVSSDLIIEFSVGGAAYEPVVPAPTPQQITNQSYAWDVPDRVSGDVNIKIREGSIPQNTDGSDRDTQTPVEDESDQFAIVPATITITSPAQGTVWVAGDQLREITWTQSGALVDNLILEYSADGGLNWNLIDTFTQAQYSGSYYWPTIPVGAVGDSVVVRLSDSRSPTPVTDDSEPFTILDHQRVTITGPGLGEQLVQGQGYDITWTWDGTAGSNDLVIRLSEDGGASWPDYRIITTQRPHEPPSFHWTVPAVETTQAMIRIYDEQDSLITDDSEEFSIGLPVINVASPSTGDQLYATGIYDITWDTIGWVSNNLKIEYSIDGGSWIEVSPVPTPAQITAKSYPWVVSDSPGSSAEVRINDEDKGGLVSGTSGVFNIIAPTINITSPTSADSGQNAWVIGTNETISWTTTGGNEGAIQALRIQYATAENPTDSDFTTITTITDNGTITQDSGSLAWPIPLDAQASTTSTIRIFDPQRPATTDISEEFEIAAPSLTVEIPNGGEYWLIGTPHDITWYSVGAIVEPLKLYYTPDGVTWKEITAFDGANDGAYTWTVADDYSPGLARVRIEDNYTPARTDESDGSFTIALAEIAVDTPGALSATDTQTISWSTTGTIIGPLKAEWSIDNFATTPPENIISDTLPNTATSVDWTIPETAVSTNVRIRVTDVGRPSVQGKTDPFTVLPVPVITITSPTSADVGTQAWRIGKQYTITWTDNGGAISNNLLLQYSLDGGTNWTGIATGVANDGTTGYDWTVPVSAQPTTSAMVRIYDNIAWKTGSNLTSDSELFDIAIPLINITYPQGGESWAIGDQPTITWSCDGFVNDNLTLQYIDGASLPVPIASGEANDGAYTWTVPGGLDPTTLATIKIIDASSNYGGQQVTATSNPFNIILEPSITITAPSGGETYVLGGPMDISWTSLGLRVTDVKIEYSSDDFATPTYTRTIIDSTPNSPNVGGSLDWTVPSDALVGSNLKLRISMAGDSSIEDTMLNTFRIRGGFHFTSPVQGDTRIANEPADITWTTDGSVANVRLYYSADGGTSWTEITSGPTANQGTFTYAIPDPGAAITNAMIRIEDDNDNTVFTESEQFTVGYYTITWQVTDYDTRDHLGDLNVKDNHWTDETATILSPINHEYPYGTYTTFWSKEGYPERSIQWTADSDKTITMTLESELSLMMEWHVLLSTSYNATDDTLQASCWLERKGELIKYLDDLESATLEVYDGNILFNNPDNPMTETAYDSRGIFWFNWQNTGLEANKAYFIKATITYAGKDYSSGASIDVTDAKKILETKQLLDAESAKTTAIQSTLDAEAIKTTAIQDTLDDEAIKTGAIKDAVESSAAKIDTINRDTADILTATEKTIPRKVEEVRKETEIVRTSEILNRENTVRAGDELTVQYRTYSGLVPTIDVYDADNVQRVNKGNMKEVGSTGIYEYTMPFASDDRGDFTFVCSDPRGGLDALIVSAVGSDIDDVASQVAAVLGTTANLDDLEDATEALNAQFDTLETALAQLSFDMAEGIEGAVTSAATASPALESVHTQLTSISQSLQALGLTGDINLEKLYEVSKEKSQDIDYLRNKTQELKAVMELNKRMIDNIANKPVTQTWFEFR